MWYARRMARLEPFAGIRYAEQTGPLSDLVAPPYDVVDEPGRAELAARHPANAILVELPLPDEEKGLDRYQNAARIFDGWLEQGIVQRDGTASFYVQRMTFTDTAGTTRSTTGVIGALAVADDVLPHEQTMPKPKGDRLYLLRATRANLSPIWGLSLSKGLAGACEQAASGSGLPPESADVEGVLHEVWPRNRRRRACRDLVPRRRDADPDCRRPPSLRDRRRLPGRASSRSPRCPR